MKKKVLMLGLLSLALIGLMHMPQATPGHSTR